MRLLLLSFLITSLGFSQQSSFTVNPTVACVGAPVSFVGQATPGFNVLSWNWNFGDGNSSTVQNPIHIYSLSGPKTITLTIQYEGISPSPFSQQTIQVNPKPNAAFSAVVSGCALPVSVSYTNTSTGAVSHAWTFGNGNTSALANPPVQSYGSAGTVNPRLIVTNSFGCKDTATQSLIINNFQAGIQSPVSVCRGMPAAFNDNSTAGADSWSWSFPGGTPDVSSLENPSVAYAAPGTYTVTLSSANTTSGCSSSTSVQITVLASPEPSFTVNPPTGCAPETISFTNTSPPGSSFVWNFGDGSPTFSGPTPPDHTYTTNGDFYPSLIMTDNNGCVGAFVYNAIHLGVPNAAFSVDAFSGCTPLTVHFTDNSSVTAPVTSWFWDFGNGNTSTEQHPTEIFDVGLYDITLTITSGGCTSTISLPNYIQVGDTFDVSFDVFQPNQCSSTYLTLSSTTDVSPYESDVSYLWTPCGTGAVTSVPYKVDTGAVNIYLTIVFRGCSSGSDPYPITVLGPRGLHIVSDSLCSAVLPATVQTEDFTFAGALSDDIDMTWTWGDGSPADFLDDAELEDSDKGSMSHIYNDYGIYTITQVTYNHTTGCRDSILRTIEIGNIWPAFTLSTNDSVCPNSLVTLDATGSTTNNSGGITSHTWLWNNGIMLPDTTAAAAIISDILIEPGTYVFHLKVTGDGYWGEEFMDCANTDGHVSCTRDTAIQIVVLTPPLANIVADDTTGCSPFPVTFTNTSTSQDNGVMPTSFEFTFPDGTQTTGSISTPVTHTFTGVGFFDVSIIATDPYGCQSLPAHDTIYITKPVAAFTLSEPVICELDSLLAVNTSANVSSWVWEVDGVPNSAGDSMYTWFDEVTDLTTTHFDHVIQLIVADSNGCTDTLVQPVVVSTPIALLDFLLDGASTNANGDYTCPPVFAEFTNEALTYGGISSYSWTFGDGNMSIEEDPDNTYVFAGTYSATFAFVDEFGCPADTTLVDFLTIGGPSANPFWTQDASECARIVHFDLGPGSVGVVGVTWNLNDGNTVTDSLAFDHLYAENQTYYTSATIVDADGCQVLYPLPPIAIPDVGLDAYFTASPAEIDLGQVVYFSDQSTSAAGIANWTWDLATIPVFTNPDGSMVSNQYTIAGAYPIILAIEDVHGCLDTFMLYITVDPEFGMPNVFTGNGDGVNDVFSMPHDIFDHFDIVIVNRWGNVIHDALDVTGTIIWDGRTDTGELCSDGVYFYIIKGRLKNGTAFDKHGFLELFTGKN